MTSLPFLSPSRQRCTHKSEKLHPPKIRSALRWRDKAKTHLLFRRTHLLFRRTHLLFRRTHLLFRRTHLLFRRTHLLFRRTHLLFRRTHLLFRRTHLLFRRTHLLFRRTHLLFRRVHNAPYKITRRVETYTGHNTVQLSPKTLVKTRNFASLQV